ncbi:hypothetical protein AX16_007216 [Volvariella volvacea WC 439]|nr:hypothetical protein AX16_007216 [Volvariella volvacea WC 439]
MGLRNRSSSLKSKAKPKSHTGALSTESLQLPIQVDHSRELKSGWDDMLDTKKSTKISIPLSVPRSLSPSGWRTSARSRSPSPSPSPASPNPNLPMPNPAIATPAISISNAVNDRYSGGPRVPRGSGDMHPGTRGIASALSTSEFGQGNGSAASIAGGRAGSGESASAGRSGSPTASPRRSTSYRSHGRASPTGPSPRTSAAGSPTRQGDGNAANTYGHVTKKSSENAEAKGHHNADDDDVDADDEAFMISTLSYLGSPAARTLGLDLRTGTFRMISSPPPPFSPSPSSSYANSGLLSPPPIYTPTPVPGANASVRRSGSGSGGRSNSPTSPGPKRTPNSSLSPPENYFLPSSVAKSKATTGRGPRPGRSPPPPSPPPPSPPPPPPFSATLTSPPILGAGDNELQPPTIPLGRSPDDGASSIIGSVLDDYWPTPPPSSPLRSSTQSASTGGSGYAGYAFNSYAREDRPFQGSSITPIAPNVTGSSTRSSTPTLSAALSPGPYLSSAAAHSLQSFKSGQSAGSGASSSSGLRWSKERLMTLGLGGGPSRSSSRGHGRGSSSASNSSSILGPGIGAGDVIYMTVVQETETT